MNNVFFIELIIESFNNAFDSTTYEYEERTFINDGIEIDELNEHIKHKFRYRFVNELLRQQEILQETKKMRRVIFLEKIKEASFNLGNNVLEYKQKKFEKSLRNNLDPIVYDGKDLFFNLIETYDESYSMPLSSIIETKNKGILFNLIDVSFITTTIDNIALMNFNNNNNQSEATQEKSHSRLQFNSKAGELFSFLCESYRVNKEKPIKYINIFEYLKKDADRKTFTFNLTQDEYKKFLVGKTNTIIGKFSKSPQYAEREKPILADLEKDFRNK